MIAVYVFLLKDFSVYPFVLSFLFCCLAVLMWQYKQFGLKTLFRRGHKVSPSYWGVYSDRFADSRTKVIEVPMPSKLEVVVNGRPGGGGRGR